MERFKGFTSHTIHLPPSFTSYEVTFLLKEVAGHSFHGKNTSQVIKLFRGFLLKSSVIGKAVT